MRECDWDVFSDAGTLYNPLSIASVLDTLVFNPEWKEDVRSSLFEREGYVHSWLFDSHFSRHTEEEILSAIGEMREKLLSSLENAQAMIITFGTSWTYFLTPQNSYQSTSFRRHAPTSDETGVAVSNCHKMPQAMFFRRRLSVAEIVAVWGDLCVRLKKKYPGLTMIFTVSPVRHLKDGFEGNSRSKATLLLAVEDLCQLLNRSSSGMPDDEPRAIYFPAFEIVCDDLRDYRFYSSDLAHPSDMAVEYIWEIFLKTFLDEKGRAQLKEGNRAFKFRNHRPIKK